MKNILKESRSNYTVKFPGWLHHIGTSNVTISSRSAVALLRDSPSKEPCFIAFLQHCLHVGLFIYPVHLSLDSSSQPLTVWQLKMKNVQVLESLYKQFLKQSVVLYSSKDICNSLFVIKTYF